MKTAMNLEDPNKSSAVVFDLNNFYMKQRSESVKNMQKKGEAAQYLHSYKGSTSSAEVAVTGDAEKQKPHQDAAAYFSSIAASSEPAVVTVKRTYDFSGTDYRAFVFMIHEDFGIMLLHCTRKRKKGPHFQLPGGHVDETEFIAACEYNDLLLGDSACSKACARNVIDFCFMILFPTCRRTAQLAKTLGIRKSIFSMPHREQRQENCLKRQEWIFEINWNG